MKRRKASIQSNTYASVLSQAKTKREKQSDSEWMKANRREGKKWQQQQQRMTRKQYVAN